MTIAPSTPVIETQRTVFLRGLLVHAHIGAYEHELDRAQPVRIDLSLEIAPQLTSVDDDLANVVCYDRMATNIQAILDKGHIKLVETLAEQIAAMALDHPMVQAVTIDVAKLEAIAAADAAGVQIRRAKKGLAG